MDKNKCIKTLQAIGCIIVIVAVIVAGLYYFVFRTVKSEMYRKAEDVVKSGEMIGLNYDECEIYFDGDLSNDPDIVDGDALFSAGFISRTTLGKTSDEYYVLRASFENGVVVSLTLEPK